MAGHFLGKVFEIVEWVFTRSSKNFFHQLGQGKQGRAGIKTVTVQFELGQFTAIGRIGLETGYPVAFGGQSCSGSQCSNPGPDDPDVFQWRVLVKYTTFNSKMSQKFKATIFFFWCALSNFSAYSQDSIACLYNKRWEETTIRDSAAYFRTGEKLRSGKWNGPIKDYYISGKLQMSGNFIDDRQQGLANFYYENGRLSSTGYYQQDNKEGLWKNYYENGYLQSEGNYSEGDKNGLWKYYYMNGVLKQELYHIIRKKGLDEERMVTFSDSLGNITVKKGNGKYYYFDPSTKWVEEGSYADSVKTGEWKGKDQDGKSSYVEEYKEGNCINGKSTDSEGNNYTYTEMQTTSEFPGGIPAMMTFLKNEVNYPKSARKKNVQGKVYVEFIVDQMGKVTNVKIKRGVEASLDEEAIRVVKLFPDWKPATNRGKPVRQRYVLPINFKIT